VAPERRQQSAAAIARRAERLQAKREVVLRATIDIINEGDINPSMPKIVDRSGIPERSIFRYFDDIADLTRQVLGLALRDLADIEGIEQLGVGPLDDRIHSMVAARLELLERVRYIGRVARMRVFLAPDLAIVLDDVLKQLHHDIAEHFAPELSAMSSTESDATVDALTALVSFEGYDVLRRRLERSPDDIAGLWRVAIERLLG
jgi:AcrR family transcriptional regulator